MSGRRDDPILELRDATVEFGMERGESRVLDNVDLTVERGEILGIVGESGSGKSMLASSMMNSVVDPGVLTGEVTYHPADGEPVDLLSRDESELKDIWWEEIAFLIQAAQSGFNPTMTIRGHFVETLKAHDSDVDDGLDRARELLSELQMDPESVLQAYPHELSGGMKQRALTALSLILDPDVLVMDEPTSALDLLMQRSIISLLSDIQEEYDLTMVFVTHDLAMISDIADSLAVMYAFEIVEEASADELLQNPTHPYTRALINSVPNINTPISEMEPIQGSSPDPVNVPSGCSYHPRCPLADDDCRNADPYFHDVTDDHQTACFHWEQSEAAVPLHRGDSDHAEARTDELDTDAVLSIDDLKVHFHNSRLFGLQKSDTVRAVDGISLDIHEREVIALVGESGCGKTTLGKAAIGLHRPTEGSISYRGQDIWDAKDHSDRLWSWGSSEIDIPFDEIRRSLQIIHQDPESALASNYTVESILSEPLNRWEPDLNREDKRKRIYGLLEFVGMSPADDYASRYPHQLSGGEQQRVALIRALMMNPDLILADEAVSALDVSLRIEMIDLMIELQNQFDTSFLFISHNLSNARYFAKKGNGRIAVMYLGKIVEIGKPEQVVTDPKHPYTKVLQWATGNIHTKRDVEALPLRNLDIPDPADPLSGCPFHTRCPEAREACKHQEPPLYDADDTQRVACFREDEDHEYWESPPLDETEPIDAATSGGGRADRGTSDD